MTLIHRFFVVALLGLPITTLARVQAPPRPIGSDQVQVSPGLDEAERERAARAHRAHPIRPARPNPRSSAQPAPATPIPGSPR